MSSEIVAALISAGASITVALLSKNSDGKKSNGPSGRSRDRGFLPERSAKPWFVAAFILLCWFLFSPAYVHHDFAGTNFLAAPIVFPILALIVPIRPLKAASIALAVFAANFMLGPFSNIMHGSPYDREFGLPWPKMFPLLLIGFGGASLTALFCYLRLRGGRGVEDWPPATQRDRQTPKEPNIGGVARELEKLARLHKEGRLSDEEFRQAKNQVLQSR